MCLKQVIESASLGRQDAAVEDFVEVLGEVCGSKLVSEDFESHPHDQVCLLAQV